MFWEWEKGRPLISNKQYDDHHSPTVMITPTYSSTPTATPIRKTATTESVKLLGIHLSPSGDFGKHIEKMKEKADAYAIQLKSPRISPADAHTVHHTIYCPALKYSLPALAINEECLHAVQSKILASIQQKMGVSSTTPTDIRHGPEEMGGLDLMDLQTECGIESIQCLHNAIYKNATAGKLMLLSIHLSQLESSISKPILEHPGIEIPYLAATWITSIRQYLFLHNITITVTTKLCPQFRGGKHDKCIMECVSPQRYTPQQLLDLNLVRIYVQAWALSDISTADGQQIQTLSLSGERDPSRINRDTRPQQHQPTKPQQRLWRKFISSNFVRYHRTWNT